MLVRGVFVIKKEVVLDLPNGLSLNIAVPSVVTVDDFLTIVDNIETLTHKDSRSMAIKEHVLRRDMDKEVVNSVGHVKKESFSSSHNSQNSSSDNRGLQKFMQERIDEIQYNLSAEMQRMKDYVENVLTNSINEFDTSFSSFGGKFNKLVDHMATMQAELEQDRHVIAHMQKEVTVLSDDSPTETLQLEMHELRNKVEALSAMFDAKLASIDGLPEIHSMIQESKDTAHDAHAKIDGYESKLGFVMEKYRDLNERLEQQESHEQAIADLRKDVDTHAQTLAEVHDDYHKKIDELKVHYDEKLHTFMPDLPPPRIQKSTPPKKMEPVEPIKSPIVETPLPEPKPIPQAAPQPVLKKKVAKPKKIEHELPDMLTDLDHISSLIDKQISDYKKKKA